MRYNIVCPLAEKDVDTYFQGLIWLERYLDIKDFIVIGNEKVKERITEYKKHKVLFIDENRLISYAEVRGNIAKRSDSTDACMRRTGWYLQQFLKISYSLVCDDEYYLLWDADTLPIHRHDMVEGENLIFDMKTEHHKPYFETFAKIFPKYEKRSEMSYISEHMLIKTSVMRELINEIGMCNIGGDSWHEKIINAIDIKDLPQSGFADYETYGLFCLNKYPDLYIERKWDSLRPASNFFDYKKMRECDYEWIRKDYDALSFESDRKLKRWVNILCRNRFIQRHFSCKELLKVLHQFTI